MNIEECFIVMMPSRNGSYDAITIFHIALAAVMAGKRQIIPVTSPGHDFASSKNECLKTALEKLDQSNIKYGKTIRAMMIHDTVRMHTDTMRLVRDIIQADKEGANLTASYKTEWNGNIACLIGKPTDDGKYTMIGKEELDGLKNFQRLEGWTGNLGLYYGEFPTDYKFHWDSKDRYSEDIAFYRDNGIVPSFWDLPIQRKKEFWI